MKRRLIDRVPFTALGLLWPFGAPPQERGPSGDVDGASFRLVSSNALRKNRHPDRWAEAVLALEPDVLCVVELTPALDAALSAAASGPPPHRCADAEAEPAGTGLWSRWPMEDARILRAGHTMIAARIPALGATVTAIHTVAPSNPRRGPRWWESFAAITTHVERTDGPLVVAGDWNATMGHTPLRRLVADTRLRDGHTDAGRPYARTWPSYLPVALLDRVLVSPEIAVRAITEHKVPGTDHRAIAADLVVTVTPPA